MDMNSRRDGNDPRSRGLLSATLVLGIIQSFYMTFYLDSSFIDGVLILHR